MKNIIHIILFIILPGLCFSQSTLDTNKLAVFGQVKLSLKQIQLADSLLIVAVNYYNDKVKRGDNLISLSEQEYSDYLELDSTRQIISPYLTKKGKVKKYKLKHLPEQQKEIIQSLLNNKDYLNQKILELENKGSQNNDDPIVSFWGSAGVINLSNYYRQYQIITSSQNDEILIYAYCICDGLISELDKFPSENKIDWKKIPLKINDGGICFFKILIDLKTMKAKNMSVNGI